MKFNEKLIELRKKEGLSQEELGFKLNVTRQTVSKWELGTTKPEMDKLAEISNLFNISVDELINETEKSTVIEDQPIKNENDTEKNQKMVGIVLLVVLALVILAVMLGGFFVYKWYNKKKTEEAVLNSVKDMFGTTANIIKDGKDGKIEMEDAQSEILNSAQDIFGTVTNTINEGNTEIEDAQSEEIFNSVQDIFGTVTNTINEGKAETESDKKSFNRDFEFYSGTGMGSNAISVLDEVISNNKKEERKITVKYKEIETQSETKIQNEVETQNKTETKNEIETQDEDKIKNIKRNIDNFGDYEIFFDYDADGFINKVTIEKIK